MLAFRDWPSQDGSNGSNIKPKSKKQPHFLPCKIKYSGPTKISKRHWSPKAIPNPTGKDTLQEAYFRGRKLIGREIPLPKGYTGLMVKTSEDILPRQTRPSTGVDDESDDEDDLEETKLLDQLGEFESVVVWGHDAAPESSHSVITGLQEWFKVAGAANHFEAEKSEGVSRE